MILRLASLLFWAVHILAAQPSAPAPLEAPLRDLKYGTLNFLHTTDTHGWHAGHLLEPSFSADWGDYIDFAARMREKLEAEGKDLLLIDTGDRVEGNGLYDASDPKGKYTFEILKEQPIDIICSGNHELYKQNSSENEYLITIPAYKDNYLASNLDIIDPVTRKIVPLAPRYKKFTTKKSATRIMAFGFLYNFLGNYNNTVVTPVEQTIKQQWFQDAIRDSDIDLFLVIGHVALRSKEFDAIHKAIRDIRKDIPIQFFGGHYHIRDYRVYDSRAHGLASGRFMETIGFQSMDGVKSGSRSMNASPSPSFFRRYIDNNLFSFYHHSGCNASTFHSEHGRRVSNAIADARSKLNLDKTFGCADRDLWMSRAPYPSNDSIFTWLEKEVLPGVVNDSSRSQVPRLVITNTGAIRFDIFKGPFTTDSTFIISPFTSGLHYIKGVPYSIAKKLLPLLNQQGSILSSASNNLDLRFLAPPEQYRMSHDIIHTSTEALQQPHHQDQQAITTAPKLTPGYTTTDDLGTDGDDTIHSPIDFYNVPNCIQSVINPTGNALSDTISVDLVFNEFIQLYIILALKVLGVDVSAADVAPYMPGEDFTSLILKWVSENWAQNCKEE